MTFLIQWLMSFLSLSEDYATMCNLPLGGERRMYGHDALVAGPVHQYELIPGYLPSEEQQANLHFHESEEREYLYISFYINSY